MRRFSSPSAGRSAGRQQDLRRALLRRVCEDDIRRIIARVVQQAQAGDLAAVRLLLELTPGPPPSTQEMTEEVDDEQDND